MFKKRLILAVLIVLVIAVLGYKFADKFKVTNTKEETPMENLGEKTETTKGEKMSSFKVYVVGEIPFTEDEIVKYETIKSEAMTELGGKSIVLVDAETFASNPKSYQEGVNNGLTVLVYANELDVDAVVEDFGINIEKAGIDSANNVFYQGYGYANINGEKMPMFVAASEGTEGLGEASFEELFKEVVKQNETDK